MSSARWTTSLWQPLAETAGKASAVACQGQLQTPWRLVAAGTCPPLWLWWSIVSAELVAPGATPVKPEPRADLMASGMLAMSLLAALWSIRKPFPVTPHCRPHVRHAKHVILMVLVSGSTCVSGPSTYLRAERDPMASACWMRRRSAAFTALHRPRQQVTDHTDPDQMVSLACWTCRPWWFWGTPACSSAPAPTLELASPGWHLAR
jgi:hypothetical protein